MKVASSLRIALALSFVLACSSGPAPGGSTLDATPGAPNPDEAVATEARIRCYSERDGFAAETDAIVYTDMLHVRVDGVPPRSEVTVTARMYSPFARGRGYASSATFTAGEDGSIDTGTMAPTKGTYTGVDPDGLVWSAKPVELAEGLGERTALFLTAEIDGEIVAERTLGRTTTAPGVREIDLDGDGLVGTLYLPEGATDRVPVVAFGGSEGGLEGGARYAWQIASWGHPVLALAYFGAPGVPSDLVEIPLEYFEKALQALDARPETRKGKAIVIGGSRGGELALQLAATFPSVIGVVAETPSSHRWPGLSMTETKAAWTLGGSPLPYVPPSDGAMPSTTKTPSGELAYALSPIFVAAMKEASSESLDAARIEIEKSRASILMLGGADDAMWPACDFITGAMQRLEESGHAKKYQDEAVCFPGAGHVVGSVGVPTAESMWAPSPGAVYALGGTAEANARAGRAAATKVRAFLDRVAK